MINYANKSILRYSSLRRFVAHNAFQSGDSAIVRQINRPSNYWFIESLSENDSLGTHRGNIPHSDIIGKGPREVVHSQYKLKKRDTAKSEGNETAENEEQTKKYVPFIITHPSFDEYIRLVKRDAQPIYGLDANTIGHLADIHVDYPEIKPLFGDITQTETEPAELTEPAEPFKTTIDSNAESKYQLAKPPVQFLEAGTGHGSLTLTLAKLLHPPNAYARLFKDSALRGAILHTIDCNINHSNRGKKNVRGFKRGMYYDNVEFHVAEGPSEWLQDSAKSASWKRLFSKTDNKFLSGCFLDMPDPQHHVEQIATHLQTDAPLIVFQPSITQFLDIINVINLSKGAIKLSLTQVLELTPGIGAGMREWDLKISLLKQQKVAALGNGDTPVSKEEGDALVEENTMEEQVQEERVGIVCRPKVAVKTMAGGFLAIFKKVPEDSILKDKSNLTKGLL